MLRKSVTLRIALAFVLVAFITAALVAIFIRITSADRLTQLVLDQQRETLQTALTDFYLSNGSWENLAADWQQVQGQYGLGNLGMGPGARGSGMGERMEREGRGLYGLADAAGRVVVPLQENQVVGQQFPNSVLRNGTDILVNGQKVGTLVAARSLGVYNTAETLFLERTNRALILAMIGAMLLALVIGLLLAQNLTQPLRVLTQAAQRMAGGQLDQQVKIDAPDEIGQLGSAFNQMSREVARVNEQRRQMTADIAHDLRTPLTVISGYVESMRDGVLAPTTERFDLIYNEIGRLQNMVTDLRMLSQADSGELRLNLVSVEPAGILQHTAEIFRHHAEQQQVHILVEAADSLPNIRVDEARFMQVMDNLVSNALRYTPAGGTITLGAERQGKGVSFRVSDTGSGIGPDDLPLIFDRFQRGDKSRHADGYESGLGLAIVKALVEAHGGKVSAESKAGAGTTIRLWLPAQAYS